jgi:TetR/AcrR family transcriptional regulator, regulator of cefoperazone and chloramphenicol sensitivity
MPGDETRQHLLDAAIRLFADHGYAKVTVRDICREAGANLASVNYHFGDKMGLYMAVCRIAVDAMRAYSDVAMRPPDGCSAEAKLRHYISTTIPLIVHCEEPGAWILQLMLHEMAEPTEAAPWIVDHALQPRLRYLAGVMAELLETTVDDPRVPLCVMSVQSQFMPYRPDRFRTLAFGPVPRDPASIAAAIEHVTRFSLAGIRAIAAGK